VVAPIKKLLKRHHTAEPRKTQDKEQNRQKKKTGVLPSWRLGQQRRMLDSLTGRRKETWNPDDWRKKTT
jgi:hypothetical protein